MFKPIICDGLAVTTDIPAFVFVTAGLYWPQLHPISTISKVNFKRHAEKRCSVLRFLVLVFRPSSKWNTPPLKTPVWDANWYVSIFNSCGGSDPLLSLRAPSATNTINIIYFLHIFGRRIPFVLPRTSPYGGSLTGRSVRTHPTASRPSLSNFLVDCDNPVLFICSKTSTCK